MSTGGATDDDDGEDDEESESSSSKLLTTLFDCTIENQREHAAAGSGDALDTFRDQWKTELRRQRGSSTTSERTSRNESPVGGDDGGGVKIHESFEKARLLYLAGADHERHGDMHEAVRCYAQAVRLVPDIERRLFATDQHHRALKHSTKGSSAMHRTGSGSMIGMMTSENIASKPMDDDDCNCKYHDNDLVGTLTDRVQKRAQLCLPDNPAVACYISSLPTELIVCIFKWVIGADLDVRMLEQLSMTSSGFYIIARNDDIWRLICRRTWGDELRLKHLSWRSTYIDEPHILCQGVYISKMTYIRHGESSFQDHFYRPWHIIVYYRYIRFFADGVVVMLTTSDEPASIVPLLRTRAPRFAGILIGRYLPIGYDRVSAEMYRPINGRRFAMKQMLQLVPYEVVEQKFVVELKICAVRKRNRHSKLQWMRYESATRYYDGSTSVNEFDLNEQNFPSFYYSRVKSYAFVDADQLL